MPRRNSNAGQPNRVAQMNRRALRVQTKVAYRPDYPVLNPGSDSLVLLDRSNFIVREKVSA